MLLQARWGAFRSIVKATRGGYDGKGVWLVDTIESAADVLSHDQVPGFLVEERVAVPAGALGDGGAQPEWTGGRVPRGRNSSDRRDLP